MEVYWDILGLEPTEDMNAIRDAYTRLVDMQNPEDDPEGYQQLQTAYEAACNWARSRQDASALAGGEEKPAPNPMENHEALRTFRELYTGKQRNNPKTWETWFTSDPFLDVARDPRFTAAFRKEAERLKQTAPPPSPFLQWLSVAYLCRWTTVDEQDESGKVTWVKRCSVVPGMEFEGIEDILAILSLGPAFKAPRGNLLIMSCSYQEWIALEALAVQGVWNGKALDILQTILGYYTLSCLNDRCQGIPQSERYPAGLRLITHFYRVWELPESVCRCAWDKLDLDSALMGRPKVLYGDLREIILQRVPDIAGEKMENFRDLTRAFDALSRAPSPGDPQALQDFFAREDLARALRSWRFVQNNLLSTWTCDWQDESLLRAFQTFYRQHPDLPAASRILERIQDALQVKRFQADNLRDRTAEVPENPFRLDYAPFFRHWLNTGFYSAYDPETDLSLLSWLNDNLPWQEEWSRRFLGMEEDRLPEPRRVICVLNGMEIVVEFHLRYQRFLRNGEEIIRPWIPWSMLKDSKDSSIFFLLLPITVEYCTALDEVRTELIWRLQGTAAPANGIRTIADCLANRICSLDVPPEGEEEDFSVLPCEWHAEDANSLYGCAWLESEDIMVLYQQTFQGQIRLRDLSGRTGGSPDEAGKLARGALKEVLHPVVICQEMVPLLPDAMYCTPNWTCGAPFPSLRALPQELKGSEVTREQLADLFQALNQGWLKRLELSWNQQMPREDGPDFPPARSLVFQLGEPGWALFFLDDVRGQSFAAICRPGGPGTPPPGTLDLVPFLQGKLFNQDIHPDLGTIARILETALKNVLSPSLPDWGDELWSYVSEASPRRTRYLLDKRRLAGFPPERAHNALADPFYLDWYPSFIGWNGTDGTAGQVELRETNRGEAQKALRRLMAGELTRLRLTFGSQEGEQWHVVVLREQNRSMLACLSDRKEKAEFHVADTSAYMDVEGKKYPKTVFQGRMVPAYLVHQDPASLRLALEDLLGSMLSPDPVLNAFGAYASENPVKARKYPEIRADLLNDSHN